MYAIRKEVENVARTDIREVVFLRQNIDACGRDMYPRRKFAKLLSLIHDVDGIDRIWLTSSHPWYILDILGKTCAQLPKVMPFFHIPPQSESNEVLKAVRRKYTAESFKALKQLAREDGPDAAICGEMMVGVLGETEEQFQDSLKVMEEFKFDVVSTAAYLPRPSTPPAVMDH